jgi:hypothetical protein
VLFLATGIFLLLVNQQQRTELALNRTHVQLATNSLANANRAVVAELELRRMTVFLPRIDCKTRKFSVEGPRGVKIKASLGGAANSTTYSRINCDPRFLSKPQLAELFKPNGMAPNQGPGCSRIETTVEVAGCQGVRPIVDVSSRYNHVDKGTYAGLVIRNRVMLSALPGDIPIGPGPNDSPPPGARSLGGTHALFLTCLEVTGYVRELQLFRKPWPCNKDKNFFEGRFNFPTLNQLPVGSIGKGDCIDLDFSAQVFAAKNPAICAQSVSERFGPAPSQQPNHTPGSDDCITKGIVGSPTKFPGKVNCDYSDPPTTYHTDSRLPVGASQKRFRFSKLKLCNREFLRIQFEDSGINQGSIDFNDYEALVQRQANGFTFGIKGHPTLACPAKG